MDKFAVIIPAAGQGKRMNREYNKQFLLLDGLPIIVHTLKVFQDLDIIENIIVVCAAGEREQYLEDILPHYGITKCRAVVAGGKERQDSVYRGLTALSGGFDYTMVHDGARPLVSRDLIVRLANEVKLYDAVVAGVPVKDTVKRADAEGFIVETIPRDVLWNIQTPQVFRHELLKKAHEKAKMESYYCTDDASLVERLGVKVKIIEGSYENIKITTPEDLSVAETILRRREGDR